MAEANDKPTFLAEPSSTYDELKASAETPFAPATVRRAATQSAEAPGASAAPEEPSPVAPTRVVAPAVDVTAWEVPPGAAAPPSATAPDAPTAAPPPPPAAEEPPPVAAAPAPVAEQPPADILPAAPPTAPPDPLASANVAQEVESIVRRTRTENPEGVVMQGFLDDLATAPHSWASSTDVVEEASGGPGKPAAPSTIFLTGNASPSYTGFIQPVTQGTVRVLINGRNSNGKGPDIDRTEPLDEMQDTVQGLASGDTVYLTSWFFSPDTALTRGAYKGATTWGAFFGKKADEGVKIRILINDFDPITGSLRTSVRTDTLAKLDAIIGGLTNKDNLKYVVNLHPAHVGPIKAWIAGQGARNIHVASHHQKLMVCRRGSETISFAGGVDIELTKTPSQWGYPPPPTALAAWHDLHARLEGPIARDIHKQFVMRWNREKDHSSVAARPGWSGYETLSQLPPITAAEPDNQPAKKKTTVQMLRTVSSDATLSPFSNDRDDIRQVYRNILASGREFLFFENQYFRALDFADRLAAAAAANPQLVAIFVVTPDVRESDGNDPVTLHGSYLQHEFFDRVTTAFGPRVGIFTMARRMLHSKFFVADDRWMTIGSANCNGRSFELDSEVNVAVDDAELVRGTRRRLWAHELGATEATVGGWKVGDYIPKWNAVATANEPLAAAGRFPEMAGEGIVHFDWKAQPGKKNSHIPDAFAYLDFDDTKEFVGRDDGPQFA